MFQQFPIGNAAEWDRKYKLSLVMVAEEQKSLQKSNKQANKQTITKRNCHGRKSRGIIPNFLNAIVKYNSR